MPEGCIFADKGPAAFVEGNDTETLLALCAIMNSKPFGYLVTVQLARTELARSYEVGLIQQTPVPDLSVKSRTALAELARLGWSLRRQIDTANETSHAFVLPATLMQRFNALDRAAIYTEIEHVQAQIDGIAFHLYGIDSEDHISIEAADLSNSIGSACEKDDEGDAAEIEGDEIEAVTDDPEALLSWAIGVVFGRFDINLATGGREMPPEPRPFDPLPTKSPGMLPDGVAPFIPCTGMLVDDLGHADDFVARVAAVYVEVGEPPPELDVLRKTLACDFFQAHIKMYSKSRRKAPIYWQLATPSASYSIWLYVHAFSKDTLFRVQNDYVATKLAHEQRELNTLRTEAGSNSNTAQRRAIEAQETFVEELQTLLDEVKRVSPLWDPDLGDGVIINFAPLWRLVPQNRAWQKELRSTWDALVRGDYDWSHLAMHLWPERVVPKCATDRSLAIAHGLEDVFWFEDEDDKWKPREERVRSVNEIVKERTSPAVKDALRSLIEAPETVGASKRGRKRAA
jgi:hypothetical protein